MSTSNVITILPLTAISLYISTSVHACVRNSCMVSAQLRVFFLFFLCVCAGYYLLRKYSGGGSMVDMMFGVRASRINCGVTKLSQYHRQPWGHSLSVHPQPLSKTFHFLLGRCVTTACLCSWDQIWCPQ